ncbi:MlaD family protein [Halobacteriovorax sp.]|uniref:MlaD family protein n=1 Tax=Halobacteriovorax sp. TaxID=2020862 RepID=UPI003AF2B43D
MNEFKVGLMALAAMIAVVVMSLVVTSNQSGFGAYNDYYTTINDASGIFPKTPIKVAGINAGRIKDIQLTGNKARISFEVLERVKITKGSKLRIRSVGFLGDKYLEIYVANNDELLPDGSELLAEEKAGIETLLKDASEVMQDVKVLVGSIKESFVPEGGEPAMKKIVADVQETITNTKELTGKLNDLVGRNNQKLQRIIDNLEDFTAQIAYQTDANEPASAVADVKEILKKADNMMADLEDLVQNIKDGKGTVGKLLVEEEIADEVKSTLSSVQKVIGRVDSIRTQLSVYTGANTRTDQTDTTAELRIFPSPGRFYLVGVTTSEFGPERRKITETTVGGTTTIEDEKVRKYNDVLLNLQLGRRIDNWTFRGGLIDSYGGLAVDYNFDDWNTITSLEVFDYRDNIGPNIRIGLDFQLWSVIYGKIEGEDLINDPGMVYSLGLKFNDEDIKGLVGIFL